MKLHKSLLSHLFVLIGLGLFGGSLVAAPLANTPIGNQAKATYTDDSGVQREVFSNTVITRVAEVYALTLVDDNTKLSSPGSIVYFSHTVTNEGNAPDTFDLSAINSGGDFNLTNLFVYPDTNQDGLPDNFTPITASTVIAPGGQFNFVVAGNIPVSAAAGQSAVVTVSATSQEDGTQVETNTDTVTVTNAAVMQVTKAIDTPSGVPGTQATYTITYTNTGSLPAAPFTIEDIIPSGMEYVPGSARWSVSGAGTPLDDGVGGDPAGIAYDFGESTPGVATFEITSVNAGQSGFVRFTVEVEAGRAPGNIPNTAQFSYTSDGDDEGPFNTNTVPFNVLQVPGVTLTPPALVPSAPAGSTVTWANALVNTGTGTDTFDITIISNNFPTGTSFQLFQSDGNTPMTDSNGNGTPDTGPIGPGGTYNVVIKANIPSGASGDNGGAGFNVVKRATSGFDPGTSDEAIDELGEITAAGVDLTANSSIAPGVPGEGQGPEGAPVVVNATNPGTTTIFNLFVNNTGPNTDSYNLLADQNTTFGSVNDLPPGWTVVFRNAAGSVITNTGPIPAGDFRAITAEVFVPAGTPPGEVSVFFQSLSPTSNSVDVLHAAVDVNVVRNLSLQTDNVGQTFPGGSVIYEHVLTNNGNVVEGSTNSDVLFALASGPAPTGWTTTLHYDADGDGVLDSTELPIDFSTTNLNSIAGGIAPGQSLRFFVRVIAPLGAADGATLTTTISATTINVGAGDFDAGGPFVSAAPPVVSNTDTTNVVRGDLTLVKEQAISLNNDGTLDTAFTTQQVTAPPGAAIVYRIRVTNVGSADATFITVNDTVPANTTFSDAVAPTISGGTVATVDTVPVDGAPSGAALLFNVGTLTPTEVSEMTFRVVINE